MGGRVFHERGPSDRFAERTVMASTVCFVLLATIGLANVSNPVTDDAATDYQAQSGSATVTVSDGIAPPAGVGLDSVAVSQTTFNLTVSWGWNIIALPLVDHGLKASTLGLLPGDVIGGFNSSTQSYDRYYIVGISPPSMDFELMSSESYWVHAQTNETIEIIGNIAVGLQQRTIVVPLGGGWAFIGFASLSTTRHASSIPPMYDGGSIAMVVRYDPAKYRYLPYIVGVPMGDFPLVPGEGYLIYCTGNGTLSYWP